MSEPTDILSCPLHAVDTTDPEFLQDPHPFYRRLRQEAPVYRHPETNIVSVASYELIRSVGAKPLIYSNNFAAQLQSGGKAERDADEATIQAQGRVIPDTLLTADPPAHTRYRKLAMKAFSYKRILQMGDYVEALVDELIDDLPEGGCEFKTTFANKLPMFVIADALGIDRANYSDFEEWSNAFVIQLSGVADKPTRLWAAEKIVAFQNAFVKIIGEKRKNRAEDVISDLVHADLSEDGDDRKMTDEELLSIIQQLLVAGNETTAHTLTAGLYYLIEHPDQMSELRADPAKVNNFVEEVFRYLTPSNNMWRICMQDTELAGVKISEGDLVLLRYGSGNRDESHFPNSDSFDLNRENAKTHLAFGAGIHSCLGAQLARKELQIAFPKILKHLDNIALKDNKEQLMYIPSILLRGVFGLNITYDKRA